VNFKHFKKLALAVLILLVPALATAQQNLLLQTTLTAAVPSTPSTNPFGSSQTFITVAAIPTGVTGLALNPTATLNQQNQWQVYIDRELMNVISINGLVIQVQRGVAGTVASPHPNADMVLFGRASWFYVNDPGGTPGSGAGTAGSSCTAASILVSPYLNIRTGAQWLCSTITSSWVPGWNNAGGDFFMQTATVPAAAGVVLPTGPLFVISGAGAITGFTIPLGCNATAVGGCQFTVIAAAGSTWTWTAAGNIMTAGTGTAGHLFTFVWSQSLLKWVPSSLS
jgi:hypothetical protein